MLSDVAKTSASVARRSGVKRLVLPDLALCGTRDSRGRNHGTMGSEGVPRTEFTADERADRVASHCQSILHFVQSISLTINFRGRLRTLLRAGAATSPQPPELSWTKGAFEEPRDSPCL